MEHVVAEFGSEQLYDLCFES